MAGYPYTNQVTDDNAKKAIIAAFDRIGVLTAAQDALQTAFTSLSAVTVVTNPTTGVVTPIPPSGGGGLGSFNTGDLIVADTPSTLIGLPDLPPGNVLLAGGAGVRPFYGKVGLTTHVSGTLSIGNGGTNSATALSGSTIMISNGSAIVQGAAGSTTTVLHGNAGGAPTYGAVSLTADVTGVLPYANFVNATAVSVLVGRGSAAGAGVFQEITLGANLTMTGTVLSAAGGSGSPGGSTTQVQFNLAGAFAGDADMTFVTDTLTVTKAVMPTSVSTPSLISTAAVTVTPAAGSNVNIALSTTGDFVVNTTQLYVDTSTGFIGHGIATPQRLLHLDSGATNSTAALLTNDSSGHTTSDGLLLAYTTEAFLWNFENSNLTLATNNTPRFVIQSTGRVSMGVTPGSTRWVHIDSGASEASLLLTNDSSGHGTSDGFYMAYTTEAFLWNFENSQLSIATGNVARMQIAGAGGMVFNESGADADIRMEGDTEQNLFFLDASTDRVGIGTNSPASLLTVNGLLNTKNYTVATLPGGTRGDIAYVTDALAPAFLAVIVGGGAVVAPVFYNGANWVGF